ncbi:hypothetical protein SESBI_15210 [Sesbania bispinosa]|nr:hypothetical protein SESBI_15210 [Sesbania bispinosa]
MRSTTGRSTTAGRRLGAPVAGGGWRRVAREEETTGMRWCGWTVVTKRRISRATMDCQRTAVRGEEDGEKPTVVRDVERYSSGGTCGGG